MCKELDNFVEDVKRIYGDSLVKIILFGSRARGDYSDDSDYDVMVLTSLKSFEKQKSEMIDASFYVDVMINPMVQNNDFYTKWKHASPLYSNIEKDGEILYDRCS